MLNFYLEKIKPLYNSVGETGVEFEKAGSKLMMFCETRELPFMIIHKWHIGSFL